MLIAHYVPGKGYTVRDSRGLVVAHGLTIKQRGALLACNGMGVIPSAILRYILQC